MSNPPTFTVALSPTILWPITFFMPQEDGPETEVSWMFRFKRPLKTDSKTYVDALKRRNEREAKDFEDRMRTFRDLQFSAAKSIGTNEPPDATEVSAPTSVSADAGLTDDERAARLDALFDPAGWRNTWWKGWKAKSLVASDGQMLDPDNAEHRDYVLTIEGVEEAIDRAIREMMTGGRQKNLLPPLAS